MNSLACCQSDGNRHGCAKVSVIKCLATVSGVAQYSGGGDFFRLHLKRVVLRDVTGR